SGQVAARSIALPGGDGYVLMDYLACDRAAGRLWIPAGNTCSVDVLELASGRLERISGFATSPAELFGRKVKIGPSAVTLGEGVAYIGNRGDSSLCVMDQSTLARGACIRLGADGDLAASPDGLAYVAAP